MTILQPEDLGGALIKFYVRTAGNNGNDGLAPETAWATLAYAKTQIPFLYVNGGYIIDITGVTETLTSNFDIPLGGYFWGFDPSSISYNGALTIHSDMIEFLVIPAIDIASVDYNPITGQTSITTSGLTANQLTGKQVFQRGILAGVVKNNSTTVIEISGSSYYIDALDPISFSDPGATLWELSMSGGGVGNVCLEGINLKTNIFAGLSMQQVTSTVYISGCDIDTYYNSSGSPIYVYSCFISPSMESSNSYIYTQDTFSYFSVFKDVYFSSSNSDLSLTIRSTAFENCGPICSLGEGIAQLISSISETEFLNSPESAVFIDSIGTAVFENVTIDGSVGSPIQVIHPANLYLINIPEGVSNGGIGVELSDSARCIASSNVYLRGSGTDDVKIGTLAAQTWASVTAATGNRITDLITNLTTGAVTGDGFSVKRTA